MMESEHFLKFNTTSSTKKVTCEWKIKGWDPVAKVKELKTDTFELPEVNKSCFLQINPCRVNACYYYLKLFVDLQFEPPGSCWVKFCTITNGEKGNAITAYHEIESHKFCYSGYCKIQDPGDNSLTIQCEIFYIIGATFMIEQTFDKIGPCNNLNALYQNKKLFDVTILVGNEKFQAHSTALASVSTYFLSMFENENFIESRSRVVDLTKDVDITVENFSGFLEYIYGNKNIEELDSIVSELIILADKFDVKLLHNACELFISENISQENIIKVLILSDKYRCHVLKKKAIIFAKNNINFIKKSEEFSDLCKNIDIVRELL